MQCMRMNDTMNEHEICKELKGIMQGIKINDEMNEN